MPRIEPRWRSAVNDSLGYDTFLESNWFLLLSLVANKMADEKPDELLEITTQAERVLILPYSDPDAIISAVAL